MTSATAVGSTSVDQRVTLRVGWRDYEAILEFNYHAVIAPGWTVIPDFQYIWHPGGHVEDPNRPGEAVGNATVFGVRTTISY